MLLHLDPTIPLLWRDPTTLQFGVDPVVVVVADVTTGLERLVAVLAAGVSESGYAMLAGTFGVTPFEAERLRERLADCLLAPTTGVTPRRAAVLGDTPLAHGIARLLEDAGLRTGDVEQPDLVVLVGDRVIPPSEHRGWLQRDIPHVAVTASDSAITVGHIVEPGATACLHCADLHRRDTDPAWPAIAAQLAMLPLSAAHPLRTASAVALAGRVVATRLREGVSRRPPAPAREFRISGDGGVVTERVVQPHPECRCAAPPESDWAPADAPADLRPTTRATASASHA